MVHKKVGAILLSLGQPCLALSALFGIIRRFHFFLFYTDYFNRFSIKTCNWRIALSDKERHGDYVFHRQGNSIARKKCFVVSILVPQLNICLKQSLNLWWNLRLRKWLNLHLFGHVLDNVKNWINIDLKYLIDLASYM